MPTSTAARSRPISYRRCRRPQRAPSTRARSRSGVAAQLCPNETKINCLLKIKMVSEVVIGKSDRAAPVGVASDRVAAGAVGVLAWASVWRGGVELGGCASCLCWCLWWVVYVLHGVLTTHPEVGTVLIMMTRTHHYAIAAGQLLATLLIAVALVLLATLTHYGDATTLNQGYSVGSDTGLVEIGWETVGTPGPFGHIGGLSWNEG